jgi:hypothetical protein
MVERPRQPGLYGTHNYKYLGGGESIQNFKGASVYPIFLLG